MNPFFDKLNKDWSIVGFDFPGHGQSNMPESYYNTTYDLFGYAIRYAVKELEWDKFHIVAHSMGTFCATPVSCLFIEAINLTKKTHKWNIIRRHLTFF